MTAAPFPSTVTLLDALTATGAPGHLAVSRMNAAGRFRTRCFATDEVDAAAALARKIDDAGDNAYIRTTLLREPLDTEHRRGRADETGSAPMFTVDLDIAGPGHADRDDDALPLPPDAATALEVVRELPPPSIHVDTGGGRHLWWLLDEPEVERPVELLESWAGRIVEAGRLAGWHVDRPDAARVLRVPGTHRRKPGVEPNRVSIVDVAGAPPGGLAGGRPWCPAVYAARDLLELLPTPPAPAPPPIPRRERVPGEVGPADAVSRLPWSAILVGWTFAGMSTMDGTPVELWRRPGDPSSAYSLKAIPDGPAVAWSDRCGLPTGAGQRLNKWRVLVALHASGDEAAAAREIRRRSREARP